MLKIEAADVPRVHVAVAMYADLFIMLVQGEGHLQGYGPAMSRSRKIGLGNVRVMSVMSMTGGNVR